MFIDFGISSFQKEAIGYESEVTYRGTPEYCGPQMELLYHNKSGKVDLYYNDYVGL